MMTNRCRFQWHPKSISFCLAVGIALSIYSSVDCRLVSVDLGFQPKHYNTNTIEIGLWSFESPDGSCARHDVNDNNNNDTIQEGYLWITDWSKWFINDDFSWTTSRIFALTGVVFGNISLIIALRNSCIKEPLVVDVLIYTLATAILCEASKLGLFFNCAFCQSNYWYNINTETFVPSISCKLGDSALFSIGSLAAYLIAITISLSYACRPIQSNNIIDYYDEKSLQSWMHNGSNSNNPLSQRNHRQEETQTTVEQYDTLEGSDRSDSGLRNRKTSMEALHNGIQEDYGLEEYGDLAGASIIMNRRYSVEKKLDEMSAVSWDEN